MARSSVIILPSHTYVGHGKQWSLDSRLTPADISKILKRKVKKCPRIDSKVKHEWRFTVDGEYCAIWDYYGTRWSAYGPKEAFAKLGIEVDSIR